MIWETLISLFCPLPTATIRMPTSTLLSTPLATLGIVAERSGRNDVLTDGRKISGSAFKHTRERSFHHGTLLINADLGRLVDYLNPHKKKLVSKGIKSVRSRVANLTEFDASLDHNSVCTAVMESFFAYYGQRCEPETLDEQTLREIPSLDAYYRQMSDWEWRFRSDTGLYPPRRNAF